MVQIPESVQPSAQIHPAQNKPTPVKSKRAAGTVRKSQMKSRKKSWTKSGMKGWIKNVRENKTLYLQILIMILAALFRIGAASIRPVVYSENSYYDEYLVLEQSRLDDYFNPESENERTMVKTLTFPWLLNLCRTLDIGLNTMMGLVWSLAALCIWSMMRKWTSSRWMCLFAYGFVLFCPIGFENNNGVHLYRNLILAPFLFIFFGLLVSLVFTCWKRPARRRFPWIWTILGLCWIYPAAYYIKEDGFWMKPVLLLFLVLAALGLAWTMLKRRTSWLKGLLALLCLFLPSASFQIQTERYLDANEKAFGYRGITVRTEGPIQDFAKLVYQIQSDERNLVVWAPEDAVKKAIEVSPTLQEYPDFLYAFNKISWQDGQTISGDFLPWKLWDAWVILKDYQPQGNIRRFLPMIAQASKEIEAAFEDGRLERQSGRIFLVPTLGSRSWSEILAIFPDLLKAFDEAITLRDYNPIPPDPVNAEQDFLASFEKELGTDLQAPKDEAAQKAWEKKKQASAALARMDFGIYRLVLFPLFWIGLASWFYSLFKSLSSGRHQKNKGVKAGQARTKRKKTGRGRSVPEGLVLLLVFILVGTAAAYQFAIVWFEQFLYYQTTEPGRQAYWLLYYSSSMLPMLYIALLLMLPFDVRLLRRLLFRLLQSI